MSQINDAIERVESLRTTYDMEATEAEIEVISKMLSEIRDREERSFKALQVLLCQDGFVEDPPEWFAANALIDEGLATSYRDITDEACCSVTAAGIAFFLRTATELHEQLEPTAGVNS